MVVNLTGPAVDLDVDTLLTPDGLAGRPADRRLLRQPGHPPALERTSATTVNVGGAAQLPGSLLVPTAPSTTTLSGLGTNGRILVAGDLVHTGTGELHAYPFLPDEQLRCAPDLVHVTTLTLDVVLVDPDDVVAPDRFFHGEFECTKAQEDVTPDDNTWKLRAGAGTRVLSDEIPAGAVCTVTERLDEQPAPLRVWAEAVVQPEVVIAAKRQVLGFTITNRVKDLPPAPPTQPSTPTPTPTATPTPTESVPEPPAPPTPSSSPTPSTIVEPTNRPELPGSPSAQPTTSPTTSPSPTGDAEAPNADPPRQRWFVRPHDRDRAVHAPRRLRMGTDAAAQPADAGGADPASAEAAALAAAPGAPAYPSWRGRSKSSEATRPSTSTAAGSSIEVAIAWLKPSANAVGSLPPVELVPSNAGSPSAASRASISTAMAAEPSTAPTWRVAL